MPNRRLSTAIIAQFQGYVQKLGAGCPKPSRKFLGGMTLGMAMAGSALLSEAARSLHHFRGITFHALHKGLCRGLKSRQWAAGAVQEAYLGLVGQALPRRRIIACDLGDITKPRARRMPGLRTVRDGSTGELKKGWWLIEMEAIFGKRGRHLPLWLELFSVARRGYKSQRTLVEKAIGELAGRIGRWGLWVFDRGFDNWQFFAFLGALRLDFLVRVKGNRCVTDLADGRRESLAAIARKVLTKTSFVWSRRHRGTGYLMHVGYAPIQIPQSGQTLFLIVARGFGKHPLLLLTNQSVSDPQAAIAWVRAYLKRWGVEEAGRLVKQAFDLENVRVLSWQSLVKLVWLALWTYGLLCWIRIKAGKLYRQLLSLYPSFGPVPRFPYYRLACGLARALFIGVLTNPSLFFTLQKSG